jgi:hypothetical protein
VAISSVLPSWLVLAASEREGANGLLVLVQSIRIMAHNLEYHRKQDSPNAFNN